MNSERQGTAFRCMVICQSDPEVLHRSYMGNAQFAHILDMIPLLSFKCNFGDMEQYIREFYADADGYGTGISVEISSVNGDFSIGWSQDYWERDYFDTFLKQLEEFGIRYTVTYDGPFKISKIQAPWEKGIKHNRADRQNPLCCFTRSVIKMITLKKEYYVCLKIHFSRF